MSIGAGDLNVEEVRDLPFVFDVPALLEGCDEGLIKGVLASTQRLEEELCREYDFVSVKYRAVLDESAVVRALRIQPWLQRDQMWYELVDGRVPDTLV